MSMSSSRASTSRPSSSTYNTPGPYLTFIAAEENCLITAVDANHQGVASFVINKPTYVKGDFAISRILRPGQMEQPFCVGKKSSLSGTTKMTIHGQEVKMRQSWEGMHDGRDLTTPLGLMKWRLSSVDRKSQDLLDAQCTVLARWRPSCSRKKEPKLEVFVPGDVQFLDTILASWVGLIKGKGKDGETISAVADVVSALAGS